MQTETLNSPPLARKIAPINPSPRRSEFLLWTVISAAYAAVIIQYSTHYGRLAAPPYYDDVSYFVDALARLEQFYSRNWARVCLELLTQPPHSLFSAVLAIGAYLVFGTHDWAPYAGNTVIILGLAGIINLLARGLSLWIRLLLFAVAATTPISLYAVYEFRPDIASAMVCAAGVMLLLVEPLVMMTPRRAIGAGMLFGLSTVMKTPTFPMTMGLLFTTLVCSTIAGRLLCGPGGKRRQTATAGWLRTLGGALVLMLPVYLTNLNAILEYIYKPLFGADKDVWVTHVPLRQQLLYYLTGEGGGMSGWHLYLFGLILLVSFLVLIVRRNGELLVCLSAMCVAALAAYTVVTIMQVRQMFFGSTFHWILLFIVIQLLIWLARRGTMRSSMIGIVGAAALAILTLQPIPRMYNPGGANAMARTRVIHSIYDALVAENVRPRDRIYITTTGFVNSHVLGYMSLQRCMPQLSFHEQPFSGDLAKHRDEIAAAKFVIASESGNSEAFGGYIPSGNIQDQTLAIARADQGLVEIAAIPTENPKRYFVFKRAGPFYGWTGVEGLGQMEGPYPGWNLDEVRWTLGPKTIVKMPDVPTDGDYEIVASGKAAVAGADMEVSVDGKAVTSYHFMDDTTFDPLDIPLHLSPGHHELELTYSNWSKKPGLQMAVLFKAMRLSPTASGSQLASPTTQPASLAPRPAGDRARQ